MSFEALKSWRPRAHSLRVRTLDTHTGGEPLRIIVDGVPPIPGATILERRKYVREHLDWIRTTLMYEPRGHREMYGCLVVPPVTPGAHLGALFMHTEGYSTMCGHGVIALAMVAVETGLVPPSAGGVEVRIDTPAGLVVAWVDAGHAEGARRVTFRNVPSFVLALDRVIEVPDVGWVKYDLAYGGAFYAHVEAATLSVRLTRDECARLTALGTAVTRAVAHADDVAHPTEPELSFLYGSILVGPSPHDGVHSRNVCIFGDGQIDRSPTGTGVSARLAVHHARGELGIGDEVVIESIVGSRFTGRIVETTRVGHRPGVVTEVTGTAFITGHHEFLVEAADPLGQGFRLG
jgi:trans-L-3-hydroxyproline dehydratase